MIGLTFRDFERYTAAGGLARRGGAGSLYSMSAVCAMYDRIREQGGRGLIYSLGGASSSHGAVVLGRERATVPPGKPESAELTEARKAHRAIPRVKIDLDPEGEAQVATYTVIYENRLRGAEHDPYAVCVARRGERQFIAALEGIEPEELAEMNPGEIIGRTCRIGRGEKNTVTMKLE
jgi:hypothetical protein